MKNKANFVIDLILKLILWAFLLIVILWGVGFFFIKLPPTIKTSADHVKHAFDVIFRPVGALITILLIIVPAIILIFDIRKFLMTNMGKS